MKTNCLTSVPTRSLVLSIGSIVLSTSIIASYTGLRSAVGFIALLLIHELGHVYAIWRIGHGIHVPYFIPFMGAVVFMRDTEISRHEEAYVGYYGPFIGTIAALAVAVPFIWTNDIWWLKLCAAGVGLNLFNMIPISPLDGGRVTQAVSKKLFYLGLLMLTVLAIVTLDSLIILLIMFAVAQRYTDEYAHMAFRISIALYVLMIGSAIATGRVGSSMFMLIFGAIMCMGAHTKLHEFRTRKALDPDWQPSRTDNRPLESTTRRLLWFGAYALLLCVQIWSLYFLFPFIVPKS